MKLKSIGFMIVLIWATQFTFAQETNDIDSLIKDITVDNQLDVFSNYSYTMEYVRQKKGFWGKSKLVKRFNVLLPSQIPKGRIYKHRLMLVYDSEQPLTSSDIINNRKEIVKHLEKVESEVDNNKSQETTKSNTGGYVTLRSDTHIDARKSVSVDLLELVKSADFSNYKELKVNGRDTISIDFRPLADKVFSSELFYLKRVEGIILIDKDDKRIIEVEAFPTGKLSEYRSQTPEQREQFRIFHYLQTRVPEGFWFPKSISLNFMEFPKEFDDLNLKIEFNFSEYNHFVTSVDKYNIEENKSEDVKENEGENN